MIDHGTITWIASKWFIRLCSWFIRLCGSYGSAGEKRLINSTSTVLGRELIQLFAKIR